MSSPASIVTDIGRAQLKPWVEPVINEIANHYGPLYFVYGYSPNGNGEHPLGRALDFSILEFGHGEQNPGNARPALGEAIANYLWSNRRRLNVWYVIWNRRIISTTYPQAGWQRYNGVNPHTDHVHSSYNATGVYTGPIGSNVTKEELRLELARALDSLRVELLADSDHKYDSLLQTVQTFQRRVLQRLDADDEGSGTQ